MKMIIYGVRNIEEEFFHKLNVYHYDLTFVSEILTHDNVDLTKDHQVVMLRGNCIADVQNLQKMKAFGIKYLLTRTVGYDHIDLDAVKELGFDLCARVPSYSPNAVSELAVSLTLGFTRKTFAVISQTSQKNFLALDRYFSKELRFSTVGIIGMGRIGLASAKAFLGLSARVIGVDPFVSDELRSLEEQSSFKLVSIETLQQESDIIILHAPYIKGKNDNMIDAEFIKKIKKGAILINVARGELVDLGAVLDAVQTGQLSAAGLDVAQGEREFFFKDFSSTSPAHVIPNPTIEKLISYYPRVIFLPHLGSFTDEALKNMIEISYQNLQEFLSFKKCSNSLL
ncbi:MAG: NAD(P)-dependent oxidoreductase [Brevinema sp.]